MSDQVTIYHNPRCSKSRQTLALIEEKGITPEIVLYLDNPPSEAELKQILGKLDISARELMRTNEDQYKSLNLADESLSESALVQAMHENPKLIERPIVVKGKNAVLGRPPENVDSIL